MPVETINLVEGFPPEIGKEATQESFNGPFEGSSPDELYAILLIDVSGPGGVTLGAFKSTDRGVTWAQQDSSNSPVQDRSGQEFIYDPVQIGDIIYVSKVSAAGNIIIERFSITSNTWLATSAVGPVPSISSRSVRTVVQGTDIWAFFEQNGPRGIYYQIYSTVSDSWSGANINIAAPGFTTCPLVTVCKDPASGRMHVWFRPRNGAGTEQLWYVSLTLLGVASTPVVLSTVARSYATKTGNATTWGGLPVLADFFYVSGSIVKAGVWVGDAADPTAFIFTRVNNLSFGPNESDEDLTFVLIDPDGNLVLMWISVDTSVGDPADIIDRIYTATNDGGGWADPVIWYDIVADPPSFPVPPDPYDQFLHTLSAAYLSDDSLGVIAKIEAGGGPVYCSAVYGQEEGIAPPPTLIAACPVTETGVVGEAFSAQIQASGGTPPYTYTLTGGSFPPGVTLDESTGIISGTPTLAGTYDWEVTVTDSLGQEVVIECSTMIADAPPPSDCPDADQGGPG